MQRLAQVKDQQGGGIITVHFLTFLLSFIRNRSKQGSASTLKTIPNEGTLESKVSWATG